LLAKAMQSQVVTVVAGDGYGKTRAVFDFLRGNDAITTWAWVPLTERDNIGTRFWENFTHAIAHYNRALADRLIENGFPETKSYYDKYMLIPEEAINLRDKHVVVFDDFHLLHDKKVMDFIERSINAPFPNITTILISRSEPEINLTGLLLKGLAANISESELRFNESEIAAFLRTQGLSVSADSLATITADTEGWAFAVKLAASSLKKNPQYAGYARTAMKSNIFKLLESAVFNIVSKRLQRFLVRLSLLDHLSIDLIEQLAQDPALLEELKGINAYVRRDPHIHAYQIHHLFLDYLRLRQDLLSAEEKRETWLIAARWCYANDYKIDAVAYYDKVGDYQEIAEIVYDMTLLGTTTSVEYLLRIFENAPAQAVENVAIFPQMHARLLLSLCRYDDAATLARQKVKEFEALPVSAFNDRILFGMYSALGHVRMRSRVESDVDACDFDHYFRKADECYSRHPFEINGPITQANMGAYISPVISTRKGDMEEYIEVMARAVPYVVHARKGCMAGVDEVVRAELYFHRANLDMAEKFAVKALQTARKYNQHDVHNRALFYLMRVGFAQGNYAKVDKVRQELKLQLNAIHYFGRRMTYDILMAWCELMLEQPQLIAEWLKGEFERGLINGLLEVFANRIRVRYYYSSKRYHELLAFLESLTEPTRPLLERIDTKARESICLYRVKERALALEALRAAYDLSESNGIEMPFIELGKEMRTLTAAAMRDQACPIPHDWLERINRKAATYAKHQQIVIAAYRKAHNLGEEIALSGRESNVLIDLYQGLSRSEIAVNRDLSINTVKLVINTLYTKLGADNLADVVRIAAEKNLIH
jgi:LuxR family maltose regulon positive regulatory protein